MRLEGLQIGIGHLDIASLLECESGVPLEVESVPIPGRILMSDITEDAQINRTGVGCAVKGRYRPVGFTAACQSWINKLTVTFGCRRIRHCQRFDLRCG